MSLIEVQREISNLALLVAVHLPRQSEEELNEELNELALLAVNSGLKECGRITQARQQADPVSYIGKGKLESLIRMADELRAKFIVINDEISPSQMKSIQKFVGKEMQVVDRTGLILDIFVKHAKTKEAKSQVELARLQYVLPRLTRMWTHLERQRGGVGTRGGMGESQIEIDRRIIQKNIAKLRSDLQKLANHRETQQNSRKDAFKISLVGYTNAGKSTLMKALTDEDVYIKDQLFATLDTSTRRLDLGTAEPILLSDTVGFIQKLPHDLVASFRSTLTEARSADLLLKVLDASSPSVAIHIETIEIVLQEMEFHEIPEVIVLNKIDRVKDPKILKHLQSKYPDAVLISAKRKLLLNDLTDKILKQIKGDYIDSTICIPYDQSQVISVIYNNLLVKNVKNAEEEMQFKIHDKQSKIDSFLARFPELNFRTI